MTEKDRPPRAAATAAETDAAATRFEESLRRLEESVRTLETGDLPLEETIRLFEEGQRLLRSCNDLLSRAELRVKELLRGADGELVVADSAIPRPAGEGAAEAEGGGDDR